MSIISYAQNYEDVMLWRALKAIPAGFYIDIGANDPDVESVTRLFYDAGWRGVNVEPVQAHYQDLQRKRPSDINVRAAIGEASGTIELWEPAVRGWATASVDVILQHQKDGYAGSMQTVPLMTLAELCEQHVTGDIHFLKIDVEGFEKAALQGMDFTRFRPWVLVIEATEPNSQVESFTDWEHLVTQRGYQLAYKDGLNRFYLADEHSALAAALRYPPNVFDDFERVELVCVREALAKAEAQVVETRRDAEARITAIKNTLQTELYSETTLRRAMQNSTSWKLTAPLRRGVSAIRNLRSERVPRYVKRGLQVAIRSLNRHPGLKKAVLGLLNRVPAIRERLLALNNGAPGSDWHHSPYLPAESAPHSWVLPVVPRIPEALLLPAPNQSQLPWVRFTGHLEGHYSLAIVNRGVAAALEALTAGRLRFVPYHGEAYAALPELPGQQGSQLRAPLHREIPAAEAAGVLSVVHHYPFIVDELPAAQKGMLFFWEETSVPPNIVDHINQHMNLVWVAAESVKRALINSGCRTPVFVIPLGIDQLITPHTPPLGELAPQPGQNVRFLHVSSAFDRKGVDVLLASWMDAFTGTDAVELVIKTFPNPHNRVRAQLQSLSSQYDNPPRVIIDEMPLDDNGLLELYRSAHAMVLPTRGEGFNLPAAEALAMGLPVITTGHSAHVDFCTRDTATLVDFQFAPSRSHLRASDACWLEPDQASLTRALKQVCQSIRSTDPRLEHQRQAAVSHIRDTYRWHNSAQSLLASANWLVQDAKQNSDAGTLTHIALVSPWGTPCGIAEYSRSLFSAMFSSPHLSIDVYCDDRTQDPAEGVTASWSIGKPERVANTLGLIADTGAQAIVVQHQPSLFTLTEELCLRLADFAGQGRVVILELHATAPLLAEQALSPAAVNALRSIDRVIVHTPVDLNRMLTLGLADNVLLLEHGVIQPLNPPPFEPGRELGIPADALVLGSFGFALPHKGLDTLVDTIKPLEQATGRPVHLVAVNAVLDDRSREVLRQCQQRARQMGVEDQIHWVSDYQPIDICQRRLAAADYIVLPYRHTRESASGAVTVGLSAQRPVLVSPLDIFSDLANVTVAMAGHTSDDIVRAVQNLENHPDTRNELLERQQRWLESHDWRLISARLHGVLDSLYRERRLAAMVAPARQAFSDQWLNNRRRQLLIDVSELYYRNARTGIQRVVGNLLDEFWRNPPKGYDICPVYSADGDDFRYTSRFDPEGKPGALDEQRVRVGPGDLFFGLDLAAHLFPRVEHRLQTYRLSGVRVVYMVYDILPLTTGDYFDRSIIHAFDQWLRGIARQADELVCISQATAAQVKEWLLAEGGFTPAQLPRITPFHLGADFHPVDVLAVAVESGEPNADATLLERLAAENTFLMVGTIEPRKGHADVLEAFDELWKQGRPVNLVIVGKQGWMVEKLVRRLSSHEQLGHQLIWLSGISDGYLQQLYRVSTCLIAASHAEGFGLPLIEAAQRDLPVIARDIPVFREVAGDHAFYFDTSGTGLARAIEAWLALHAQQQHPTTADMPWLTWAQSARQLLDKMALGEGIE